MPWRIVTYRLATEPSRHRVAVWRELRKVGAVSLQQATWALPTGNAFDAALERARTLVEDAHGHFLVAQIGVDDASIRELEVLFTEDREAEWTEFLSECAKYEAELAREVEIEKFTLAELDEEEQALDRLRRWHRELRARDLFGAASAEYADRRLKEVTEKLEDYAERVFAVRERP
jgi:hypothetical protein